MTAVLLILWDIVSAKALQHKKENNRVHDSSREKYSPNSFLTKSSLPSLYSPPSTYLDSPLFLLLCHLTQTNSLFLHY